MHFNFDIRDTLVMRVSLLHARIMAIDFTNQSLAVLLFFFSIFLSFFRSFFNFFFNGVGIFLACEDFGGMFDNKFFACAFFFVFLKWGLARAN